MFGKPLRLALALALLAFGNACSHGGHDTAPFAGASDAGDHQPVPTVDPCETPNKGCACENADEVIDCGQVERISGDYVSCTMGKRTCHGRQHLGRVRRRSHRHAERAGGWQAATRPRHFQGLHRQPMRPVLPAHGRRRCGPEFGWGSLHQRWRADDEADHSAARGHGLLEPGDHAGHAGHHDLCAELCVREGRILQSDQQDRHLDPFHLDRDGDSHRSEHQQQLRRRGTRSGRRSRATNFSVRWTGSVIPTTTEAYTFYPSADDGVRLWINGTLVVDKWIDQGTTEYASPAINLTAGTPALFRMEYYQAGVAARRTFARARRRSPSRSFLRVRWRDPTGKRARLTVTPANPTFSVSLLPAGCYSGTLTPAWSLDRFDVATVTNGAVNMISAVPGTLNVTAYAGQFTATASST